MWVCEAFILTSAQCFTESRVLPQKLLNWSSRCHKMLSQEKKVTYSLYKTNHCSCPPPKQVGKFHELHGQFLVNFLPFWSIYGPFNAHICLIFVHQVYEWPPKKNLGLNVAQLTRLTWNTDWAFLSFSSS